MGRERGGEVVTQNKDFFFMYFKEFGGVILPFREVIKAKQGFLSRISYLMLILLTYKISTFGVVADD